MIPDGIREEAALICAIAASGGVWLDDANEKRMSRFYGWIADALELETPRSSLGLASLGLALAAFDFVRLEVGLDHGDGEAEALLRTGWSPSDRRFELAQEFAEIVGR